MTQKKPLRICMVGPSLDILGGQAVVAQRLLKRMSTISSIEICFVPVNPRLPASLSFLQRVMYVRTVVNLIFYTLSLLRKIPRIDVVHAFSASYWSFLIAPVPAILMGRLFGKHVILNYRSGEADDHLTNWRTAVPLIRLAHEIVVPSDYLVDVFARHGLKAIAVPNFVEIQELPYRRRDVLRPVFLSNRNFQAHYNVSCILRGFARIQKRMPEAELIVIGDGPLRERLEIETSALGITNVDFVGAVPPDQMRGFYDKADVYLNTPDIDNMPNSILEASTCGLPIVTTGAGGIPYIVGHAETALIIPCNDDEALANAVFRLFDEPGLASHLSDSARTEILSRYTWEVAKAGWMEVYGVKDYP